MNKSVRGFVIISLIYLLGAIATLCLTKITLDNKADTEEYTSFKLTQSGTNYSVPEDVEVVDWSYLGDTIVTNACEGTLTISSVQPQRDPSLSFRTSARYAITFTNITKNAFTDWQLSAWIPDGNAVVSVENASVIQRGNILILTPSGNSYVDKNHSCSISFTMLTDSEPYPIPEVSLKFRSEYLLTDSLIFRLVVVALFVYIIAVAVFIAVSTSTRKYKKREAHEKEVINQSLKCFAHIIESKDEYTRGHYVRVATYCKELARRLGLSEDEQQNIYYSGLLHDIGNIIVPDVILQKPGALTDTEREQVQRHVLAAEDILKDLTAIQGITEGAKYHHERYDGQGYCEGLCGEAIPLVARIINVADSFDAMCSDRSFRPKASMPYVILELRDNFGKQFDPIIAQHMLDMINEGVAPIK